MKIIYYLLTLTFSVFVLSGTLSAQINSGALSPDNSGRIEGIVVDEDDIPLIGVNIKLKGKDLGTVTNVEGHFSLMVAESLPVLQFIYVGYITQEVTITDNFVRIILKEDVLALEEVVVIGYGSMKKSDLTGAVSSMSSKDIMKRHVVNPIDAMAGKVAGVQINNNSGRPGGEMSMVIRGMNSITASNLPLFVIDGIVGADISMINPNDIESMSILKDASATAIYGARGAAGVILVTTKRGEFDSGTSVSYTMNLGVSKLANKRDVLNSREFMQVLNQAFENDGFEPIDWYKTCPQLFNPDGTPIYDTDWQDEMTRIAFSNRHYLTIVTGSKTSKTTISFGYQNEQGIMLKSWLKRYNVKMANDTKITNRVQLSTSINYNYVNESRMDDYRIGADHTSRIMLEAYPLIPVKYSDGTWSKYGDFLHPGVFLDDGVPVLNNNGQKIMDYSNNTSFWQADNGVQVIEDTDRYFDTHQLLGDVGLNVELFDGLSFKSTAAVEVKWKRDDFYSGSELLGFSNTGAIASRGIQTTTYWQTENFFTYNKTFGDHKVNGTLGASWNAHKDTGLSGSGVGYSSDFYKYYNLGLAEMPGVPASHWTEWKMNSYYFRANYTYKNRYLATFTARYDGSSVFGADNRYAFFPSGALAWVIKEEDFLKENSIISTLKLRASVGQTGNAGIGAYSTLATLGSTTVTFGDKVMYPGIIQSGMPNSNLKWETTTQYDAGVDVGLFDNRILLNLDFYRKDTKDLLLSKPISWVSGYGSVMDNIGQVRNTGFEATLNTHNIKQKDFHWYSTLIFTTNKNKVIKLSGDESDIWTAGFVGVNYALIRKGEAINSIYGLRRAGAGTWGTDEADEAAKYGKKPGDKKYVDKNKDYQIDYENDGEILGNLFPDFEMSFNNTFIYKNFDLTLDIQGKYGNKAANLGRMTSEQRTWYANSPKEVLNYWTPENQNTMIERPRTTMPFGGSSQEMQIDDNLVEDASYIRFKNLMVGYTVPRKYLQKIYLKELRVYANLENFILITKYSGFDPEVQNMVGYSQGVEFFAYPKSMNFNFGFNVTF